MTDSESALPVGIEAVAGTVRAGETVTVTVAVESGATEQDEASVDLVANEQQVDSDSVELEGDESNALDMEWTPDADAVGTVELTAKTAGNTATETVTVEDAPAEFAVGIDTADEHVSEGGTVTIVADVTNEGTVAGTQEIQLRSGETVEATQTLELDGQAGQTVTFEYGVTAEDAPETTLAVATDDNEAETSVPIVTETVTPLRNLGSKGGMSVFGWLVFAGMAILLAPLLPLLAVLKLVDMLTGSGNAVR